MEKKIVSKEVPMCMRASFEIADNRLAAFLGGFLPVGNEFNSDGRLR